MCDVISTMCKDQGVNVYWLNGDQALHEYIKKGSTTYIKSLKKAIETNRNTRGLAQYALNVLKYNEFKSLKNRINNIPLYSGLAPVYELLEINNALSKHNVKFVISDPKNGNISRSSQVKIVYKNDAENIVIYAKNVLNSKKLSGFRIIQTLKNIWKKEDIGRHDEGSVGVYLYLILGDKLYDFIEDVYNIKSVKSYKDDSVLEVMDKYGIKYIVHDNNKFGTYIEFISDKLFNELEPVVESEESEPEEILDNSAEKKIIADSNDEIKEENDMESTAASLPTISTDVLNSTEITSDIDNLLAKDLGILYQCNLSSEELYCCEVLLTALITNELSYKTVNKFKTLNKVV